MPPIFSYMFSNSNFSQSCSHFVQFWLLADLLTPLGGKASSRKLWFHEDHTSRPEVSWLESICVSSSLPVIKSVMLTWKRPLQYLWYCYCYPCEYFSFRGSTASWGVRGTLQEEGGSLVASGGSLGSPCGCEDIRRALPETKIWSNSLLIHLAASARHDLLWERAPHCRNLPSPFPLQPHTPAPSCALGVPTKPLEPRASAIRPLLANHLFPARQPQLLQTNARWPEAVNFYCPEMEKETNRRGNMEETAN